MRLLNLIPIFNISRTTALQNDYQSIDPGFNLIADLSDAALLNQSTSQACKIFTRILTLSSLRGELSSFQTIWCTTSCSARHSRAFTRNSKTVTKCHLQNCLWNVMWKLPSSTFGSRTLVYLKWMSLQIRICCRQGWRERPPTRSVKDKQQRRRLRNQLRVITREHETRNSGDGENKK